MSSSDDENYDNDLFENDAEKEKYDAAIKKNASALLDDNDPYLVKYKEELESINCIGVCFVCRLLGCCSAAIVCSDCGYEYSYCYRCKYNISVIVNTSCIICVRKKNEQIVESFKKLGCNLDELRILKNDLTGWEQVHKYISYISANY